MKFSDYADCERYAKSHVYNPTYAGWHLGGFLILRFHTSTGFFRLFRQHHLIREFQPDNSWIDNLHCGDEVCCADPNGQAGHPLVIHTIEVFDDCVEITDREGHSFSCLKSELS